jgi:hypothetical protein
MKKNILKTAILTGLFLTSSCIETTLINTVHPDGSVTRKIILKDPESPGSKIVDYQASRVPFDSTWTVKDTFELGESGDTTWVREAEKCFADVEEINQTYRSDSGGPNMGFDRSAHFTRKFRWFHTVYRFSEDIGSIMLYGSPVEDYLNKLETEFFYLPDDIADERKNSADSTFYRSLEDSIEYKKLIWMANSGYSEWKNEFKNLSSNKPEIDKVFISLNAEEDEIKNRIFETLNDTIDDDIDSVFFLIIQNYLTDEQFEFFKTEIDSSFEIVGKKFEKSMEFQDYSVRFKMPGTLLTTNGFPGKDGEILFKVKNEFFLTQPYSMWAESRITNNWAWVASGIFLLFVIIGLIIRMLKISGNKSL